MRQLKTMTSCLVLSAMAMGIVSPAAATEIALGTHVQKVEIKGDFRLRQDTIHDHENANPDRSRQRYRLRIGVDADLGYGLKARTRFATGANDQISSNQTMDNVSNQRQFSIDQAYVEYKPWESMIFRGGRMANPLWIIYSSDLIWDGDFNPEGASENFKFSLFGNGRFFVNLLQGVADEDNPGPDQFYLTEQLGVILPLFSASRLTVAGALHQWVNEGVGDGLPAPTTTGALDAAKHFSATDGNRQNASAVLLNQFNVIELTAEYATALMGLPTSFQGTYIKNQAHLSGDQLIALGAANNAATRENSDIGYQFGAIFGQAKTKGGLEVAYFRKVLQKDATVADVADSDFGDGGTNRQGHIGWIAYALQDYVTVGVKVFNTKRANTTIDVQDAKNRIQADLVVKF